MERVESRYRRGDDASEADTAVLVAQLEKMEAFTEKEGEISLRVDSAESYDVLQIGKVLSDE